MYTISRETSNQVVSVHKDFRSCMRIQMITCNLYQTNIDKNMYYTCKVHIQCDHPFPACDDPLNKTSAMPLFPVG